jgi:putative ABC transport system permease protein
MTASSRKVLRDLGREKGRSALVVAAMGIGIAAFVAVLASYSILTRALNEGYAATNPASATLRMDSVDDRILAAVRADPEVSAAEARRAVRGRIHGPAGWRALALFVVEDFRNIRVSALSPEAGAWPPGPGEILLERDAFGVAGARIGDTATVRTEHGSATPLRIAGRVHDVGQAQARMENMVYGYATLDTLALLGEERFFDQLKIVVARRSGDAEHIESVVAGVRRKVEALGGVVRSIEVPVPGEHPHAAIMGMLLLAMAAFGLFAVVLSGVLVVNLMTAVMTAQVRAVGIMKAIGGTRAGIASIYLRQAALLGGAAMAVGVPAGIVGSRVLSRSMAVFLNLDIPSFSIPAWIFLVVGAVGFLVPVAAASWPVLKGSAVPVREALDDFGVSRTAFGESEFDRRLARVGGIARPLLLSIRNGFRRRGRTVLTVGTFAAAGVFFMAALNVRGSMIRTLDRLFEGRKYDLTVRLAGMSDETAVARAVGETPGVALDEEWISVEAAIPRAKAPGSGGGPDTRSAGDPGMHGEAPEGRGAAIHGGRGAAMHGGGGSTQSGGGVTNAADRFALIALAPRTRLMALRIVRGRSLEEGETETMVANEALASRDHRVRVGATVTFRTGPSETSWRIVGIAREPLSPAAAYVPKAFFDAFHPGMTNDVRVTARRSDGATIDRVKEALESNLAREGVRVAASGSKAESRFGFDQHMRMIYVFLVVVSCLLGGVGALGLMTTMSLNVIERRREIAVLRAIGATPSAISGMLVAEGACLGALGWGAAVLAAWPIGRALAGALGASLFRSPIDFRFDVRGPAIALTVALLAGALASLLPAVRACRRPIREGLEYE